LARDILEQLNEKYPSNPAITTALVDCYVLIGMYEKSLRPELISSHLKTTRTLERLVKERPRDADIQIALSRSYSYMGGYFERTGNVSAALLYYHKSVVIGKRAKLESHVNSDFQSSLADIHQALSLLYSKTGRHQNALRHFRESLRIRESLIQDGINISRQLRATSVLHDNIAMLALPADWDIKFFGWSGSGSSPPSGWQNIVKNPPAREQKSKVIAFDWGNGAPAPQVPKDRFAVVATTQIELPAGAYYLHAIADDGVRVFVDGHKAIDNWGKKATARNDAAVNLKDGIHKIRIEYFELQREATLRFGIRPFDPQYFEDRNRLVDLRGRLAQRRHYLELLMQCAKYERAERQLRMLLHDFGRIPGACSDISQTLCGIVERMRGDKSIDDKTKSRVSQKLLKQAIGALKMAIESGFDDLEKLGRGNRFAAIKALPEYQALLNLAVLPPDGDLIAGGSEWKYLDDGSDQETAWHDDDFDDSEWKSGRGHFGYGDGDENTTISFGLDQQKKHITTYFRRTFDIEDLSQIESLWVGLVRDDGAAVFINGREVVRDNLPTVATYNDVAKSAVNGADESLVHYHTVPTDSLKEGKNVIAVEVHQRGIVKCCVLKLGFKRLVPA
jgi:tetratricopeptide (TPR) repeat protein